ncbi:hypothetical protein HPB49_002105 [Dermacentor silvarum]|uniref:Uncharacterized protein n=1 Tax=Dermacentor silvarum TaxID=543639 RepID=A0ACB8D2E3_DERSI|nr:hypothetical protein HPB49_002105 [Dermacentor silvarum]
MISRSMLVFPKENLQFRYATAQDIVLLFLGTVFAILHGAGWPLLAIVFGHMTNAFIHQQQAGFYDGDSTNFTTLPPPQTFGEAIRRSGAQSMFDPVTILEYNITMNKFALTYVIIAAVVFVSSFIHVWCWTRACDRQLYRLRQELFYSILRQDAAWFDRHRVTEVASRMNDDMERLREGMGDKMGLFIHYLSTFASGFATGFVESWELTLVIMSVTPLLAFASAFLGNMVSQSAAKEQEKYAQAGAVALEVLSKIRTVAAFCSQYGELQRYMTALEAGKTAARRKYIAMAFGFGLTFVVLYGAYALAFWYSSVLVAASRLDPGRAFIVFFAVMVGSFSLGNALPQLNSIAVAQMAAGRVFEVIDRRPDIDSYSELGVQLKQFTSNLSFKDVSFFYPRYPGHLVRVIIHRVPSCFVLHFSSSGFAVYSDGTDCSFVFVRAFERTANRELPSVDELPSADVAFDDLRAAGVSIPAGITFEGFADADKDLELCAEFTDDEIIRQVTEDSDDSDTENEEPAPTQPTSSELTRALMTLSSVYSGNMTLTEIEADMIAGKRTVQKKISDFFAPKC